MASRINPNRPLLATKIAFATDPAGANAASPSYTDISAYVPQLDTTRGRQYELDQVQAGTANLTLDNADSRFSPTNTSSPYYPNVKAMRPAQVSATWPWNVADNPDAASDTSDWTQSCNGALGTISQAKYLSDSALPPGLTTAVQYDVTADATRTFAILFATYGTTTLPYQPKAGEQWTVSFYARVLSGNASWRFDLQNGAGVNAIAPMTNVTLTAAWQRFTLTFTASADADASNKFYLESRACTAASSIQVTGLQIEPGGKATTYGRATVYDLYTGYIERFPNEWEHDAQGWSKVTASDAFSALANAPKFRTALQQTILNFKPSLYYPLSEGSGASRFADLSGNGAPSGYVRSGKYGSGTVTAGATGAGLPGDDGTVVQFTSSKPGDGAAAPVSLIEFTATSDPRVLPPATGGFSWWLTFNADAAPSSWAGGGNETLLCAMTSVNGGQNVWLLINQNGTLQFEVVDQANVNQAVVTTPFTVLGQGWIDVLCTLGSDNQTITMCVNGVSSQTYTAKLPNPVTLNKLNQMQMGGVIQPTGAGDAFSGKIGHWVQLPPDASTRYTDALGNAWRNAYLYDMPGARINRFLDWAGWPSGLRSIDNGGTYFSGASDIAGNDPLTEIQDVATSDGGVFDIDGSGNARFRDRTTRFQTVHPTCVLGDAGDGVEIPYEGDVAFDFDTTYVYSDVTITKRDTQGVFTAHNTTSEQESFSRELDLDVNLFDANVVTDMTNFLGYRYATPQLRLSRVSVECASKPWVFTTMLGLDIGTRVTARKRPPSSSMLETDCYVENIKWTITESSWRCELLLSPAFDTVWLLGCWHTTLQAATAVGATSITVPAFGDAATNPNPASALTPGQMVMILDSPIAHGPGEMAYVMGPPTVTNGIVTIPIGSYYGTSYVLNNPLGPNDTVLNLNASIPANTGWLVVEGEVMPVVSGAGTTTVTVTRGVGARQHGYASGADIVLNNGLANAHASGVTVAEYQSITRDPTTWDAYSKLDSTTRLAY